MKELKLKMLWVVTVDGVQFGGYRYLKDAKRVAALVKGKVDGKKLLLTDKY